MHYGLLNLVSLFCLSRESVSGAIFSHPVAAESTKASVIGNSLRNPVGDSRAIATRSVGLHGCFGRWRSGRRRRVWRFIPDGPGDVCRTDTEAAEAADAAEYTANGQMNSLLH